MRYLLFHYYTVLTVQYQSRESPYAEGTNFQKVYLSFRVRLLYCITVAASDKQRNAGACPTHKKSPPSQNGKAGSERGKIPRQTSFFLFVGEYILFYKFTIYRTVRSQ